MKNKQILLLQLATLGFFCLFSIYSKSSSASTYSDKEIYQRLLDTTNQKLSTVRAETVCPGETLTLSCGNHNCEPELGENELTCPSDCLSTPIRSYNAQTFCTEMKAVYTPETQEEVIQRVQEAVAQKLHIRAVGRMHSTNSQLCSDGIIISTEKLNHILGIESTPNGEVVVVEPGVTLGNLSEWLHTKDRALGYGLIGFRGVTVGGVTATGSHGSSAKHSAVFASSIDEISMIGPKGVRVDYSSRNTPPQIMRALRASLGTLGVAVQYKLKIQKQFNLHVQVGFESEDRIFQKEGLINTVSQCDFGEIVWFPHSKKIMRLCGQETLQRADRDATNVLLTPPVPKFTVDPYKLVLHYGACSSTLNCLLEDLRFATFTLFPPYKKTSFFGTPVYSNNLVGPSHRMITSNLTSAREGVNQRDWEVAVPLSKAQDALATVYSHLSENRICLPLLGVFIRFAPTEESTLIATNVVGGEFKAGEPSVLIEIPAYTPTGFPPESLHEYEKKYETLTQLLVEKYQGRAHWGKNSNPVFKLQKDLGLYKDQIKAFKEVVSELDPDGVFSNSFSENY